MTRVLAFGRVCFGLGLMGLGITHFVFQQFTTGRAPPWPPSSPGGEIWAYASGIVVIAVGVAILTRVHLRIATLGGAALIAGWALLRHVPVLLGATFLSASWTQAGKALTLIGGLLAVAAVSPVERTLHHSRAGSLINARKSFIIAARIFLGIFFLITGTQHFIHTPFVASLIPRWFPGNAMHWTYFAGVALLAGGVGLLTRKTAGLAAMLSGAMVFSWFWIVHLPRALTSVSDGIAVFEALAVAGIAFFIAGSSSSHRDEVQHSEPAATAREPGADGTGSVTGRVRP